MLASFFFYSSGDHRDLHSFPTRRSSDLDEALLALSLLAQRRGDAAAAAGYRRRAERAYQEKDRKSTRLNSSHVRISYAVFCLKKKKRHDPSSRVRHLESPRESYPRHARA